MKFGQRLFWCLCATIIFSSPAFAQRATLTGTVTDQTGAVIARGKAFREDFLLADLNVDAVVRHRMAQRRAKSLGGKLARTIERVAVKLPAFSKRTTVRSMSW